MNDNKKYPAKLTLILRSFASVYLIYLAFSLKDAVFNNSGATQLGYGAAALVFLLFGGALGFISIRKYVKKEYAEAEAELAEAKEAKKETKPEVNAGKGESNVAKKAGYVNPCSDDEISNQSTVHTEEE